MVNGDRAGYENSNLIPKGDRDRESPLSYYGDEDGYDCTRMRNEIGYEYGFLIP